MTHDKHRRLLELKSLIYSASDARQIQLSTVRKDDTVVIRFRSSSNSAATEILTIISELLTSKGIKLIQLDEIRIQITLPC